MRRLIEPSHLNLCCLQKPIIIACGSERVKVLYNRTFLNFPVFYSKNGTAYLNKRGIKIQVSYLSTKTYIVGTVNPHYTDTRYNDKILYTDNLTSTETLSQELTVNQKLCWNIIIQYFKQHMFGYLLESPHRGDSNKYPKHTFYEEIIIKHSICCISFYSLRILNNSKFILKAIYLGTNVVVVTMVHCIQ